MGEHYLIRGVSFNELEEPQGLEIVPFLHQNVKLELANHPYSNHSARGQNSSAHDVFCFVYTGNGVKLMGSAMAREARCHIFFQIYCSTIRVRAYNGRQR